MFFLRDYDFLRSKMIDLFFVGDEVMEVLLAELVLKKFLLQCANRLYKCCVSFDSPFLPV